ncbi:MAG: SPFH domain-containing protein [Bacteroidales bacterium]|nr:SPFH domain-containing protein [Bacteroidales bacterium]MDY4850364.1 SPFH domain-containing protein [Paludibacteraceae bacterium]MDY6036434.1 SPFH domain-containing protein [Paludibacteraceae bacterium]
MALIDVISIEANDQELVSKFSSNNLRLGSQLVVHPAQTAFFIHGGTICDEFTSGTYTLRNEELPILNKLVNIPFGSESPFKAEVWFINQLHKLDIKWGTTQPIQLEDPRYNIIVPVRAYGQYGMRISNPRTFLEMLVGNLTSFSTDKIEQYFKGKIVMQLSSFIAQKIANDNVSILDINIQLPDMSFYCQQQLNKSICNYGIELVDFTIMSVNVPEEDPSIQRLKEAKDLAARLKVTGRDVYQMERSFDVLETAAGNTGAGGQMMAMGAGLGAGVGVGTTIGNMAGQMINTNLVAPPPIVGYYAYVNGRQLPNQTPQQIASMFQQGTITADTLIWKAGMADWLPLSQVPELASLLNQQTPPPVPPKN